MGSFVDRGGNHIEMGLHVFFGCYSNLFRLMKKVHVSSTIILFDDGAVPISHLSSRRN